MVDLSIVYIRCDGNMLMSRLVPDSGSGMLQDFPCPAYICGALLVLRGVAFQSFVVMSETSLMSAGGYDLRTFIEATRWIGENNVKLLTCAHITPSGTTLIGAHFCKISHLIVSCFPSSRVNTLMLLFV